jgi:hypothetical protein
MNSCYVNVMGCLMRNFGRLAWPVLPAICAIALGAAPAPSDTASSGDGPAMGEALQWLSAPPHFDAQYDFEMTVQIRLLFFWIGKDDVGGGYIKIGQAADDSNLEIIRVLFGSDPAKAHGINRWGAGTEVVKRRASGAVESSAFLGFMKSSQSQSSAGAMRQELSDEKTAGRHRFEAIISRVDPGQSASTTVPFYSDHDFDLRELEPAEKVVLDQLKEGQRRKVHTLAGSSLGCDRSSGFLSTIQELANDALQGWRPPISRCYVYNSHQYAATLVSTRPVPEKTVHFTSCDKKQKFDRTYHGLQEARFQVVNRATGNKTSFTILLGTSGALRGAPVQINYQPNWWFQITLNLKPGAGEPASGR